jgi:SAM-dependent methyltransferase
MPDVKTAWDRIASLYCQKYPININNVHYGPLCPGENKLRLLGNIAKLKAVDLGCGVGQNAIALAKSGAKVTAVDFSSNQLFEAKKLAAQENVSIEFINCDLVNLSILKDEAFDISISACAMAFVRNIQAAFSEAYHILKAGGRFIVSVMHPLQYILDGEEGSMYFNSTFPFNPRLIKWNWDFPNKSVKFQHYLRSIAEYHNCLCDAGFIVKKILEPKPTLKTPHIGFSKEIMNEYPYIARHLPITLIFVALKPLSHKETHG